MYVLPTLCDVRMTVPFQLQDNLKTGLCQAEKKRPGGRFSLLLFLRNLCWGLLAQIAAIHPQGFFLFRDVIAHQSNGAFIVSLTYEIWAVKENRYASDLRNAIGIYVAVMGVFVNVLIWVMRILSLLSE